MKKTTLLIGLIFALLLTACSTKRQYFEPEKIDSKTNLSQKLPASIEYVTIAGATLSNGNIITKKGLNSSVKLKNGFKFLNQSGILIASSNIEGELDISDMSGNQIFLQKFPSAIVSVAIDGNLIAAVSASNHIYLIDLHSAQTLMEYKSSEIFSIDSRIATPVFLNSLIIYPSLDGRIYITKKSGEILKDMVISSENFFNNVIFLDVIDDNMIVATAKKIMIVNPKKTIYFDGEIKNVLREGHTLYIFKKDGSVVKTDLNFKELAKAYYKFAIFSNAVIFDNTLNMIEKTGYLIKTDLDLNTLSISKLSDEIEVSSFVSDNGFFYNKEFVEFK